MNFSVSLTCFSHSFFLILFWQPLICSLYLWLCFCFFVLFFICFYWCIFLDSTCEWNHRVFTILPDLFHFEKYPLGPSMLSQMARFYPCLWPSNIPLYIYTYIYIHTHTHVHHLFIYLSINYLLGFFHILPIVNNATMGAYIL